MTRRAALMASLALLVAVCAAAWGADGASLRDASTLELTTIGRKSGQPRTVTIWFVYGDRLYVQSGKDGKTDWYQNLLKTPAVTVKVGEREMQGQAQPVEDPAEAARVHDLFKQKYLSARVMSWFGGGFGTGKVVAIEVK
jgi:deazaflavin-dependent oxidoreductase (nitroreductase family)